MNACPRCLGGFVMTQYVGSEYQQTSCLNCGAYFFDGEPPEPSTYKDYGLCACGRETHRRYKQCLRCVGAIISQGMRKHKREVVRG